MEHRMVTLKDIAAEAGVSITTVSNVVHNRKSRVSEKKVAKIWEIIEREHYVPSMSARSLANDQSAIIAMVTYITPRTTGSTVSDPFMSSVAASVEQRTREAGRLPDAALRRKRRRAGRVDSQLAALRADYDGAVSGFVLRCRSKAGHSRRV